MYMVITCYDYLWLICRNPEQNTIVTKPGRIHKLTRISYLTKVLFLVHYRDASCDWPPRPTNETWKIYYTNQLLINHPWSFDIDIHTWRYFVYVCAHIHTYTQIYVYIRVCIYIYMQIYIVFVCMHMIAILLMYFQINCKRERESRDKKERSMCNLKMLRQKWYATHNNRLPQLRLCRLCHRTWTQSQQSLEQWKLQSRLCFLNAAVGFNHLGIYYWGCQCHRPWHRNRPWETKHRWYQTTNQTNI
jgi:hypothetical protein